MGLISQADIAQVLGPYAYYANVPGETAYSAPSVDPRLLAIDTPDELAYAKANPFTEVVDKYGNPGENFGYWAAGVTDPRNVAAWKAQQGGATLTPLAAMLSDNPWIAGQSIVRPEIPDPYKGVSDPTAHENQAAGKALYDQYGVAAQDYSQEATNWSLNNSSTAQAARDDDDLFGGMLPLILIGAAMILGPQMLAGATAGEVAAADIIAAELAGETAMASWVTGYEGILAAEGLSGAALPAAAETVASGGLLSTPTAQVASGGQFALPTATETAAASLSDAAAVGFTPGETAALSAGTNPAAGYVGGALAPNNLLTNAATQVGKEALTSGLTGRDFDLGNVATGMIGSVAGGATSAGVGNALSTAGAPAPITSGVASGAGAGVNAAITGGDVGNAMLGAGVASGVTTGLIGATNPNPSDISNNQWAATDAVGPFTVGELAGTAGQVAGSVATGNSLENALAQGAGSLAGNAAGDALAGLGVDQGIFTNIVGSLVSGAVTSGLSNPDNAATAATNNTPAEPAPYRGSPELGRFTQDTEADNEGPFVSRAVARARGQDDDKIAAMRGLIGA